MVAESAINDPLSRTESPLRRTRLCYYVSMHKKMLEKVAQIFSTGDISLVDDLFASDYIDHQRPDWMTNEGAEEFKAIVKLARSSMPGLKVSIIEPIIADNNMVAARLLWQSNVVERETIEMLKIEQGKFVEHWGAEQWSKQKDQLQ